MFNLEGEGCSLSKEREACMGWQLGAERVSHLTGDGLAPSPAEGDTGTSKGHQKGQQKGQFPFLP